MPSTLETQDRSESAGVSGGARAQPVPGVLLVFARGEPVTTAVPAGREGVVLGRDHPAMSPHSDGRISRRHALIRWDGDVLVTDLGSRNGTSVDGVELRPEAPATASRVIRIGDSLLVPARDVGPCERLGVRRVNGRVEGPALQEVLGAAAHAARLGSTLHITGESGSGKEGLARAFHAAGPSPHGPFVAVNCATIPEGVAERLLFGAKRGAYSGADADADGYIQAAHGGTLFLDEVAELSLAVQAKLLRVLETGEVSPLGAARPRKVDLRFCSATHRDLRREVAAGRLREDLYFRIIAPRVAAPPLRERREEIPWLVRAEVARVAPSLGLHVSFAEACLLRPWPGNVRELLGEARSAAQAALATGSARVEARHLGETAGLAFTPPEAPLPSPAGAPAPAPGSPPPTRARIASVLRRFEGNVSAAARELGVHRTQLRRWMERHGLDARAFAPDGRASSDGDDDA